MGQTIVFKIIYTKEKKLEKKLKPLFISLIYQTLFWIFHFNSYQFLRYTVATIDVFISHRNMYKIVKDFDLLK